MAGEQELRARRERLLGRNMSLFYEDPVHLVKGEGVWLWDADGRRYLDCYNNVPHVGHCHPRVVEAICRQASTLNTHTRYLHEGILDYVERLTATFDRSLDTAILTCTGSEANDVALRMAQAVTGRTGVIATDFTYHGNTTAVSQLSTRMPPVGGYGGHVRHVPAPDAYRPLGGEGGKVFAEAWAAAVEKAIASLQESPFGFSALIIDPFFANEGFPDLPENFLAPAVAAVKKAGGIAVTVDDTGCKRITFFDEFLVQILIGTGWGHGKSTGSRSTVVTVCMNADRDIGSGFCGKFCTFFVADGFVVILAGHDNLVPARCQFFFKDKRNFKVDFIFRNLGVVTGSTGRSFIFGLR